MRTTFPSFTINGTSFYINDSINVVGRKIIVPPFINAFTYIKDDTKKTLQEIYQHIQNKTLVSLGDGYICEYCGTYTPRGGAICRKCNAPISIYPFINPFNFPLRFNRATKLIREEKTIIQIEFRIEEQYNPYKNHSVSYNQMKRRSEANQRFFKNALNRNNNIIYTQHPVNLDGRWACQYCGTIIDQDTECHNCRGKRLPLSEIIQIDHNCLYCGSKTTGIVCNGCAANISTLTIKDSI